MGTLEELAPHVDPDGDLSNERWREYIQNFSGAPWAYTETLTEQLRTQFDQMARLMNEPHRGLTGRHKESLLKSILRKCLPTRWGITTGVVFARKDRHSAEHDIIIYDQVDFAPVHDAGEFLVVPAQAVRGIIEVKSRPASQEFSEVCGKLVATARMCRAENRHRAYTAAVWYDCWKSDATLKHLEKEFASHKGSESCDLPNVLIGLQFKNPRNNDYVVLRDIARERNGCLTSFGGWPAYLCYRSLGQAIRILVGGFHASVPADSRSDHPQRERLREEYTRQYWHASETGMEPAGFVFACAEELHNGGPETYCPATRTERRWPYRGDRDKFGSFVRDFRE